MIRKVLTAGLAILLAGGVAQAAPTLPDWTAATFNATSSVGNNTYWPLTPGSLSIFEGEVEDGVERIETLTTFDTKTILGVENRVIEDTAFIDGVLVEIAYDWYAQDTDGTVWYFGEFVENFNYDDDGNLESIDNEGSWEAGVDGALPGVVMFADPMVGDEYFQESAPGVAFDFAEILAIDGMVDIDFGLFDDVLVTGEGNLFDDPEPTIVENKLYAPGAGLVLIQELDDDGAVVFEVPLISQSQVPEPASAALLAMAGLLLASKRRPSRHRRGS